MKLIKTENWSFEINAYRKVLVHKFVLLLYLYRARNKITQLSIPTHAQLQRHRLKFIKNHLKKFLHVSVFDHFQGVIMSSLKSLLLWPQLDVFMLRVVMWQHVVFFVLGYTWRALFKYNPIQTTRHAATSPLLALFKYNPLQTTRHAATSPLLA